MRDSHSDRLPSRRIVYRKEKVKAWGVDSVCSIYGTHVKRDAGEAEIGRFLGLPRLASLASLVSFRSVRNPVSKITRWMVPEE